MHWTREHIPAWLRKLLDGQKSARESMIIKVGIGTILVVLVTLMFPHPESVDYTYSVGGVWADKDLIAPFSFPIYKDPIRYEKERQEAVRNVYPVFLRNDAPARAELDSIRSTIQALKLGAEQYGRMMKMHTTNDSLAFQTTAGKLPFALSTDKWNLLAEWSATSRKASAGIGETSFQRFERAIDQAMSDVLRTGIIDQIKPKQPHAQLALRNGTTEEIIPYDKMYDLDQASDVLATRLTSTLGEGIASRLAFDVARTALRPNIVFDQASTDKAIQIAEDDVPRSVGYVQENERIISKHDRITEEVKMKLDAFRKAKAERGLTYDGWKHWLGSSLHVALIVSLFAIYLFLFRKRIFPDNGKLTLLALLILMEAAFAYLSLVLEVREPVQYLIFVPAASMLLAIIFDSRVAFYGTITIALLVAGIRGNDYSIALASLVAGALGAYTVRDIHSRTQIFRSLVFVFLGYAVSILAISLEQFDSASTITTEMTFSLANAIVSPMLTYGLLIFFERVFNVTTDLTLLELSDFNRSLLRMLSEKAPGTFHHSITIGNLAEAAAEAIGANSILARVGGYYHDIGKMPKAEYFVENQVGPQNRHTRLKPRMSALIIQSHVKEGVELGREYGVPEKVLDFIPQHHGTTRISFFYDKALRQAVRRPGKEVINESDFRYPGPKPQTKEAGIVMLADSVEASTRSILDMTPQKLEQAIEGMIKHRFIEGELDECELTLRDLSKIKEAFFKILMGIYHQRVMYPEQKVEEIAAPIIEKVPDAEPQPSSPTVAPVRTANELKREKVQGEVVTGGDSGQNGSNRNSPEGDPTNSQRPIPDQKITSGNP